MRFQKKATAPPAASNQVAAPAPPAAQIEMWPIARFVPYAKNPRVNDHAVDRMLASIQEFGFKIPMLARSDGAVVDGHLRLKAAIKGGLTVLPTIACDEWTPAQVKAFRLQVNKSAEWATWDIALLGDELAELKNLDFDLSLTGFDLGELDDLLTASAPDAPAGEDVVPDVPANPVTVAGDLWLLGEHRLLCGDCRDAGAVSRLLGGKRANVAITSPPYASQRKYDETSGFKPIAPEEYVEWFRAVATGIESVLAPDGSYFLNIKAHADEGERHLYVMDLVLAHRRQWGWRFVDEFCWRKTDNGVPGGWQNRFKNAWEPVFHFCRQQQIKFRADAVSHQSEDCFDYSPNNPKSTSGSGLLGTGARGAAADGGKNQGAWQRSRGGLDSDGKYAGLARPSNVIDVKTESSQGSHSAPFPTALVEFFVKAFSDAGDVVFDPFMGSGTTLITAEKNGRVGYGTEISPAYCDVIVLRWQNLTGKKATLESSGATFDAVKAQR